MRENKSTRQIPWLPFTDIQFSNDSDILIISINLQSQVEIHQFLVSWPESEPQRKRTKRQHCHIHH